MTAVPALSTGDWTAMPPWPLVLVTTAAVLVRRRGDRGRVGTGYVGGVVAFFSRRLRSEGEE